MKKKLLFSVAAAMICVANFAWAAGAPVMECYESCTRHAECSGECQVCYPMPFGNVCVLVKQS